MPADSRDTRKTGRMARMATSMYSEQLENGYELQSQARGGASQRGGRSQLKANHGHHAHPGNALTSHDIFGGLLGGQVDPYGIATTPARL
jgi:hypothetical protein